MDFKLEVIGFNLQSCIVAQTAGAHRIELCDNPEDGGTTPSYGFIKAAREKLQIALFPIIRPRGGDFLYSDDEFEMMKTDIRLCKQLGCDGVVIGMLNADGTVDKKRNGSLVELAYPLGVTFHRAYDRTKPLLELRSFPKKGTPKGRNLDSAESSIYSQALEDIIEIGCERVLTSGLRPTAPEGMDTIAALVKQADDRIIIMPGSGVRSGNIIELAKKTGATEFHTSARINTKSKMSYINKAMNEDLIHVSVDAEEVKKIITNLKSI